MNKDKLPRQLNETDWNILQLLKKGIQQNQIHVELHISPKEVEERIDYLLLYHSAKNLYHLASIIFNEKVDDRIQAINVSAQKNDKLKNINYLTAVEILKTLK